MSARRNDQHHRQSTEDSHNLLGANNRNRHSQAFSSLERLAHHPHRLAHLSTILALLEVDDWSWHCIQHLRNDEATANVLRLAWPQLYQIPDDLVQHMYNIRAGNDWQRLKDLCIKTIAAGVILRNDPDSYRASGWSSSVPSSLSTGTVATTSWASSDTCWSSMLPTVQELGEADPNIGEDRWSQCAEASETAPEPPLPPPKVSDDKFYCPLPGCNMSYVKKGHFENHMRIAHNDIHFYGTRYDQFSPPKKESRSPATVPSRRATAEELVSTNRMTVQRTSNSSFSEMASSRQVPTQRWDQNQTSSTYEQAYTPPSGTFPDSDRIDDPRAIDNPNEGDFDLPMSGTNHSVGFMSTGPEAAMSEHVTAYHAESDRGEGLLYCEFRAGDANDPCNHST